MFNIKEKAYETGNWKLETIPFAFVGIVQVRIMGFYLQLFCCFHLVVTMPTIHPALFNMFFNKFLSFNHECVTEVVESHGLIGKKAASLICLWCEDACHPPRFTLPCHWCWLKIFLIVGDVRMRRILKLFVCLIDRTHLPDHSCHCNWLINSIPEYSDWPDNSFSTIYLYIVL